MSDKVKTAIWTAVIGMIGTVLTLMIVNFTDYKKTELAKKQEQQTSLVNTLKAVEGALNATRAELKSENQLQDKDIEHLKEMFKMLAQVAPEEPCEGEVFIEEEVVIEYSKVVYDAAGTVPVIPSGYEEKRYTKEKLMRKFKVEFDDDDQFVIPQLQEVY